MCEHVYQVRLYKKTLSVDGWGERPSREEDFLNKLIMNNIALNKAFRKGYKIIQSSTTSAHRQAACNYIAYFVRLFGTDTIQYQKLILCYAEQVFQKERYSIKLLNMSSVIGLVEEAVKHPYLNYFTDEC